MKVPALVVKEKVCFYPGKAGWYFVRISKEESTELDRGYMWPKKGFRSIPVDVTVGETTWKTSVFLEKAGTYFLPIKKEVRVKEGIEEDNVITLRIEVLN